LNTNKAYHTFWTAIGWWTDILWQASTFSDSIDVFTNGYSRQNCHYFPSF